MGIRLIVEVLDHWKDFGLTAGERDDLVVLAENANDSTRLTWGSVHAPFILNRAGKSSAGWKNTIGKLMRKKAITTHTPGRVGQVAVYHLEHLCCDPPHDGYQGHCTRPPRVTSQVPQEGHPTGDPLEKEGHPTGDPRGQEGHPTGAKRVTPQVTPSPPSPLTTSPLSVAERVVAAAAVVADEERETFINWINQTYQPQGPGWWRTVSKKNDFPDIAARWRASTSAPATKATANTPCTKCPGGEGWIDQPEGGVLRCPDCNPGVAA